MKRFCLLFFALYLPNVFGLELFLKIDPKVTKKFSIHKLNDVQVNAECIQNKKYCLELLSKTRTQKIDNGESKIAIGNPASDFCHSAGGNSIILKDKKHNEYDYCLFEDKYYIDSWDFFKKYNK